MHEFSRAPKTGPAPNRAWQSRGWKGKGLMRVQEREAFLSSVSAVLRLPTMTVSSSTSVAWATSFLSGLYASCAL